MYLPARPHVVIVKIRHMLDGISYVRSFRGAARRYTTLEFFQGGRGRTRVVLDSFELLNPNFIWDMIVPYTRGRLERLCALNSQISGKLLEGTPVSDMVVRSDSGYSGFRG